MPGNAELAIGLWECVKVGGTWIFVVLGWLVVSDQQQYRELAKNAYSRIDGLRDELEDIESAAVEFHTNKYDLNASNALSRKLKAFSTEMAYLRKYGFIGLATSNDATSLRKSITGSNFDKSTFKLQNANSAFIQTIEAARETLDRQLLDSAHKIISKNRGLRESIRESLSRAW